MNNHESGGGEQVQEVYISNMEENINSSRAPLNMAQNEVAQHIMSKDYMIPVSMSNDL